MDSLDRCMAAKDVTSLPAVAADQRNAKGDRPISKRHEANYRGFDGTQ